MKNVQRLTKQHISSSTSALKSSTESLLHNSLNARSFSQQNSQQAPNRVSAMTPEKFQQEMQQSNIQRGYVVYDAEKQQSLTSHPLFEELGQFITQDKRDFLKHEACFFQIGTKSNLLFSAFLHKSNRGIAHGGVRLWKYNSMEDYVRDGLRLSLGMTRKNALAGLWWGEF